MARPLSFALFDVVVAPFPYTDRLVEKRRPALVVSHPEVELEHGWLWLAMITSTPGELRGGDVVISDLAPTGLTRACRVRASKLATLDRGLILRRAGTLAPEDVAAVCKALAACAGW